MGCHEADNSRQLSADGDDECGVTIVDITDASRIRYGLLSVQTTKAYKNYTWPMRNFFWHSTSLSLRPELTQEFTQKFGDRSEVSAEILNIWLTKELQKSTPRRTQRRYAHPVWHGPPPLAFALTHTSHHMRGSSSENTVLG